MSLMDSGPTSQLTIRLGTKPFKQWSTPSWLQQQTTESAISVASKATSQQIARKSGNNANNKTDQAGHPGNTRHPMPLVHKDINNANPNDPTTQEAETLSLTAPNSSLFPKSPLPHPLRMLQ
jgi:hypothetical protein